MTATDFEYDVFLSFASADAAAARAVWETLCAGGLRVFWSDATLGSAIGQSFVTAIQESLERSRHFVLFWTAGARESPWVRAESEAFYGQCHLRQPAARRFVILPDGKESILSLPVLLRSLQVARSARDVVVHLGGRLANGGTAGNLATGATTANQPVPSSRAEPAPYDWVAGVGSTSWAVGRDRFGQFGDLGIGSAVQRMRWIEPGRFVMGSPPDEPGRFDDETQHEVVLRTGFWLADTPCPQSVWVAVMGDNPSRFRSSDRPVEQVSWEDCQRFCRKLDALTGEPGWRLPTEAEWEYACRAGTMTATYAGPIVIRGDNDAPVLDPIAWYGGNSGVGYDLAEGEDSVGWREKQFAHSLAGTRRLKAKAPNAWGLYDMLGNVSEWCGDRVTDDTPGGAADATGRQTVLVRPIRGGSWDHGARGVRAAGMGWGGLKAATCGLGFRLARGQGLRFGAHRPA